MAITNFKPAIWSSTLLSVLLKTLVYGGPQAVNRDYEGEIAGQGSSVNITSIADPIVGNYTVDTDMTRQTLTDATRALTITEQKYFDFEVDDIDQRQAANGGALMTEAAFRGGFVLGDTADSYIAGLMSAGGTGVGAISVSEGATNNSDVYNKVLVPLRTALGKRNVPTAGRFVALGPDLMGQLLLDNRFIKVNEAGDGGEALRNGVLGRAAGFTVLESNNIPVSAATASVTDCVTSTSAAPTAVAGGSIPFAGPLTAGTLVTSASNAFTQRQVGAKITGTGIPTSTTIVYVYAGGGSAVLSAAATASATVTATVGTASVSSQIGNGFSVIAGTNQGLTFAEQISKVEAFRPEARFADALKGLHVYGGKVVRPEALAVADVFITA